MEGLEYFLDYLHDMLMRFTQHKLSNEELKSFHAWMGKTDNLDRQLIEAKLHDDNGWASIPIDGIEADSSRLDAEEYGDEDFERYIRWLIRNGTDEHIAEWQETATKWELETFRRLKRQRDFGEDNDDGELT
jgi:hypothetical protein